MPTLRSAYNPECDFHSRHNRWYDGKLVHRHEGADEQSVLWFGASKRTMIASFFIAG